MTSLCRVWTRPDRDHCVPMARERKMIASPSLPGGKRPPSGPNTARTSDVFATRFGPIRSLPWILLLLLCALPSPALALSRVRLMAVDGEASNDMLGLSVAGAGDVNGDGYADIIVGADHNDAGGTDAGRAYVVFGGPGPTRLPNWVLTGGSGGGLFGNSVAGAGDVNGDGYADVIVGAPQAGGSNRGAAYVFFGGPAADAIPDLALSGEQANDRFGASVAGAGDVNGDGYDDVIVGAPLNDSAGSNSGRAYIFYGGPGADATP